MLSMRLPWPVCTRCGTTLPMTPHRVRVIGRERWELYKCRCGRGRRITRAVTR